MSSIKCIKFHLNKLFIIGEYIRVDFMNLNKAFALRLKNLLLEKKISKYKLEKETGLTHSALRYIFNEVNVDVKFSTIVKVCNALDISLSDFFNDKIFDLNNLDVD